MDDITFVKTRHHYDSYTDFWELVRLSGFPTIYIDEMNIYEKNTYIVAPMNGEWKQNLQSGTIKRRAKLMLWNLERPGGSGSLQQYTSDNQALIDGGWLDNVIVSDRALARDTGFHFVPLGSHAGLNVAPYVHPEHKTFDIIHLSCYSNSRSVLFEHPSIPKSHIYAMRVAPNSWGALRTHNLLYSKFMLNVHQDTYPFCEPLRFALASTFKLPIISQYCVDPWPYNVGGQQKGVLELLSHMSTLVKSYDTAIDYWQETSENNYKLFTTEFSFRNCIEKFL